ncbi:MAG: cytochrome c oxidase assembly protein [Gammaproteobacteria bacterium]|nr:MAG: cytochrome c oxidase assembly protein [Gammaproteobacteria bacterium]
MSAKPVTRTTLKLLVTAVGMFVFAIFIMPPLYDVFCEITGIGGKTQGKYQAGQQVIDTERVVKVQFIATNNASMPWQFSPLEYEVRVNPGESTAVEFYAKNPTSRDMVAQAIPNISPTNAAEFFHKTECFCFNRQALKAGEEAKLGLVFIVDPDLPVGVNTITLSYTIFDVTERAAKELAQLD